MLVKVVVLLAVAAFFMLFVVYWRIHRQTVRMLAGSGNLRQPVWLVGSVLLMAEILYFLSPSLRTRERDKRVMMSLVALATYVAIIVVALLVANS